MTLLCPQSGAAGSRDVPVDRPQNLVRRQATITSGERYNQRTVPCRSTRIVVGTSASPPSGAAWGWMARPSRTSCPPGRPARSGAESRPAFSGHRRVLPPRPEHARVPLRKIVVVPFELNQLDHADGSPPAAEEDKHVVPIAGQVALRERRAVGSPCFERRERSSHRDWPRVRRQSHRVQECQLGAREKHDCQ